MRARTVPSPDASASATDQSPLRMGPAELLQAVSSVLAEGGTENRYLDLAVAAESLADMVGWAEGPVDAKGRLDERLEFLQQGLRRIYEQNADAAVAALHDALGHLREAVVSHDQDVAGKTSGGTEDDDS